MTLEDLGFNNKLKEIRLEHWSDFEVGRVVLEHKDRYVVKTADKEFDAELIGNLRFTAHDRYDVPAVGDWVAFSAYDDQKAMIHSVFPRQSILERQAVGKTGQIQIIATNIDYGLILQSVNRDFNINRLERYITICHNAKAIPVVVLTKSDLLNDEELNTLIATVRERLPKLDVYVLSNLSLNGLDEIRNMLEKGKTYCLLGSSGVGKSSLLNALLDEQLMATGAISKSIDRGKHVTTHRELVVLNHGGVFIDNPGMRELGITENTVGIEITFEAITELSENCKFNNCTHTREKGCAILKAVKEGEIEEDTYNNFQKMERERSFFESSLEDKKRKDKNLGKLIRQVQKQRKNNKF